MPIIDSPSGPLSDAEVSPPAVRALRLANAGHRAVVRAATEEELLDAICRIIVEVGRHALAWIGYAEDGPEARVRPVAVAGEADAYVRQADISWADTPRGRGPTGRAIRERKTQVNRDFASNPSMALWRAPALAAGLRSSIAIPLVIGEKAIGALTIYSGEPAAFDREEAGILEAFAEDLSYGLNALRGQKGRAEAEARLARSEARYRRLVEALNEGVVMTNEEFVLEFANPRMAEILGVPVEQLVGRSAFDFIAPGQEELIRRNDRRRRQGVRNRYETVLRRGDGAEVEVLMSASPHVGEDGRIHGSIVAISDISEVKRAQAHQRRQDAIIRAILDTSPDAMALVAPDGEILFYSEKFLRLWSLSADQVAAAGRGDLLRMIAARLKDPESYLAQAETLLGDAATVTDDELLLKDGRTFSRITAPVLINQREMLGRVSFLRDVTAQRRAEAERETAVRRWREGLEATVAAVGGTMEARDPYTAGHQRRVAGLASAIAAELKLPEDQIRGLHLAATIHDIGKITIPSEILTKPAPLTDLEYQLIQTHAQAGHDVIKGVDFPWPIARIVLQHHERIDGSGYPQGLTGDQILPEAKILAVADVVDSMTSHRPYRPARGLDRALAEIEAGAGRLYDPAAAAACLKLFREKGFALPPHA